MSGRDGWFPWGKFFSPRDSLGRESRTLFFVSIGIFITWVGMVICCVKLALPTSTMGVTEFSVAMVSLGGLEVTLIGAWIGRDWLKQDATAQQIRNEQPQGGQ